ncbi:hypothetical protein [Streptomyces johnsoniae]|uniref:Zinc ribbon domain-containing protein n=1 Tax=Streptomyces johnsoniae TaxID=3075532 RepID=A0ABU2S1Z9_9ACTN|nr:hypothetical protein [Streptomyces sp. DSM 41886]MDT0443018.1 hypothetical protein [Streptomyces sp. DSM 41886]
MEKPVGYRRCTTCGGRYPTTLSNYRDRQVPCPICAERKKRYQEMLARAEERAWSTCARCGARYNPQRQDLFGCPACETRKRRRLVALGAVVGLLCVAAGVVAGSPHGVPGYVGGGLVGAVVGLFMGGAIAIASPPGGARGS